MTTLVMTGTWLATRDRKIAAGIALTLSALVKPYALAALPTCWRPWDWRLPLVVVAVAAVCYLPYLGAGQGVLGFLIGGYLHEEGFDSGYGFWAVNAARMLIGDVPGLLTVYVALAAAILGTLALRMVLKADHSVQRTTADIAALLLAGLFFLSPNYPWYFLVVVPFIPLGGGAPAWAMSLGAFLLYLDYDGRLLLWKGVISGAFLIAVLARATRMPVLLHLHGIVRWAR